MGVDVLVVGGGPAGAATAIALRGAGLAVWVVERSAYREVRVGETFPPVVREPLQHLGVWERFVASHPQPSFATRSLWGSAVPHDNDSLFHPHGAGWHVDRAGFDALLAGAAQDAGVQVLRVATLESLRRDGDGWEVLVRSRDSSSVHTLAPRLIVDATGRRSQLARRLGARQIVHDHLIGVVAFCAPGVPAPTAETHTLVEAVETGWWYSAPLPSGCLVLAYVSDAELFARDRARSLPERLRGAPETAARAAGYSLEHLHPTVFAAGVSHLDRAAGAGWLAVGDAALSLDPLSSLGVHSALTSGLRAAQAIAGTLTTSGTSSERALTLDDYALHARENAAEHLASRATFYAVERRWPDAPFWRHRQRSAAAAAQPVLDPALMLQLGARSELRVAFHGVAALMPGVDLERLLRPLASGPKSAFELASAYRTSAPRRTGDRVIVESLAMLLRYQIVEADPRSGASTST